MNTFSTCVLPTTYLAGRAEPDAIDLRLNRLATKSVKIALSGLLPSFQQSVKNRPQSLLDCIIFTE